jgi:hypothetical protein
MIRRRGLIGLAIAAAAMTAAAVAVHLARPAPATVTAATPVLPALADDLDAVDRLILRTADGSFTVARDGDRWVVPDKGGYAADETVIQAVLVGLAELRLEGARTARPALYDRLGVQDPGNPGARSIEVLALDGAGEVAGSLILGELRIGGFGLVGPARYVRRPEQAQSWLAAGALDVPRATEDWLERRLMDIPRHLVREVRIEGPDRPALVIRRDDSEDDAGDDPGDAAGRAVLAIVDLPGDRVVDRQDRVDALAAALEALDLTDVRPADELAFAADGPRAVFTTFDGQTITARLTEDPRDAAAVWVAFEAEVPASADIPENEPGDGPGMHAAADVAEEVRALNGRVGGWAYRLPRHTIDRLRATVEDITEPAPS